MTTPETIKLLEFTSLCHSLTFNTDQEKKYNHEHKDDYGSARDKLKFLDNFAKLLRCTKKNVVAMAPYLSPEGASRLYVAENIMSAGFEPFVKSLIDLCKKYTRPGTRLEEIKRPLLKLILDRNRKMMTQKFTKKSKIEALSKANADALSDHLRKEGIQAIVLADWEVRKHETRLKTIDQALLKRHQKSDQLSEQIYELVVQDYVNLFKEFQMHVSSISKNGEQTVSNHALATVSKAAAKLHHSSLYPFIAQTYDEALGKYIRKTATHEIASATIINCLKKKSFKTLLTSADVVFLPSNVQEVELRCWKDVARQHGASPETIKHIESERESNGIQRYPQGKTTYAVHAEMLVIKAIIENHPNLAQIHVGVSKLCCRACVVAIRTLNRQPENPNISVSGTHNKIYKLWMDPGLGVKTAVLDDLEDVWKAYLQKVHSMYRGFLSDSDQDGDLTDDEEVRKGIADDCLDDPLEEDY